MYIDKSRYYVNYAFQFDTGLYNIKKKLFSPTLEYH